MMLSREDILRGLTKLDARAREAGILIDMAVYGGSAMAMIFDSSRATRDVDAVVRGNTAFVRDAAAAIAEEEGWPTDWLNDGVKGFLSAHNDLEPSDEFTGDAGAGLRLSLPVPEYLFAMKCMAMRSAAEGASDRSDIQTLLGLISLKDTEDALSLVEKFYPRNQIPAKVRFGIEEIMEEFLAHRRGPAPE